ncbi:MAG TPA: hypothetical protein VHE12_10905 [bacterium]|nr:hypothetical protein [bacterium]
MKISPSFFSTLVACFLVFGLSKAGAWDQELQTGYVFDFWNSNFIYHGSESRLPLSYRLSNEKWSFQLSTAFVLGDYQADATPSSDVSKFSGQDLSDLSLRASVVLPTGGDVKSSFSGGLNIPTGDDQWEAKAGDGAVPYNFDPSYYHGRGWDFNVFYTLNSLGQGTQWGVGFGFLQASSYLNSGEAPAPWGALVGMGTLGFPAGADELFALRGVYSRPLAANAPHVSGAFTLSPTVEASGQWVKKLGRDRLQLTVSYDLFGQSTFPDMSSGINSPTSETFLGDRLRVRPFLAWVFAPGVAMESGLEWKHILSNGYATDDQAYNGGGDLLGALQSATFQVDPATFFNLAGSYQYVLAKDYAKDTGGQLTNVTFNQFTFGANVGFKW